MVSVVSITTMTNGYVVAGNGQQLVTQDRAEMVRFVTSVVEPPGEKATTEAARMLAKARWNGNGSARDG